MRIVHVETGNNLYGGAYQVVQLLNGLDNNQYENILFCPSGSKIATMVKQPTEVYEVPILGEFDPRFFIYLQHALRRYHPDILHAHSRRGADLWCAFASGTRLRGKVLTRRVDNPEKEWVVRAKYQHYDRIIAISDAISRVLRKEGVPEAKISVVRSAVDFKEYQEPPNRDWFRSEFGFSDSHVVIGVIAQFISRKGHYFLIEAIPKIIKNLPQSRFLFFGRGPLKEQLIEQCLKKGVQDYVNFAGFRNDISRILPRLDLVVHPALMEGLGVSLIQAAAAGVPVVATKVGGIPEIVRDGFNGLLVEPGSTEAIASSVIELLNDRITAKRLGDNGKKLVIDEFSIDSMVRGNINIYRQLA